MIKIQYDGKIDIAIGRNRKETSWKNKQMFWSEVLQRLSKTHYTAETHKEYLAADRPRQDEIKDIGGFVGGYLTGGRRLKTSVLHRQLLTLDADFARADLWETFCLLYGSAAAVYSTHKHSPDHPRLRLVIPLDREVLPDEYRAIARRVAGDIGINDFDRTGFQPSRLMYWPSTSRDGEFIFQYQDGSWLKADEVLSTYHNWQDVSEWPMTDREKELPDREMKKQGDPLEKPGIVGAFCRTYDIHEAIQKFLPDVYEPCDTEGRYTYVEGSTAAGLITYDDKFAYSHHSSDPASEKLCNAFDLVRLHKYGLKDEDARPGTPGNKLPSYLEMVTFIARDPDVRMQLGSERLSDAQHDFSLAGAAEDFAEDIDTAVTKEPGSDEDGHQDQEWLKKMDVDGKGRNLSTVHNAYMILKHDHRLKDRFALDLFEHREIALKSLPWRKITPETRYLTDKDDAGVRYFIEKVYSITGVQKIRDGMDMLMLENSFHPVRDYLSSLEWDGTKRIDTLLTDYLGVKDSEYTRAVTRKILAAAVARVFKPGIKMDYMPVIMGEQGKKKSMLIDKLGRQWFTDSFYTVEGKEAYEQIQGSWIVEVAELAGMKKAEVEAVKHFVAKRKDKFRVAYGRRVEDFPRQCVFFATTNSSQPLKDPTGGRRFWPVRIDEVPPIYDVDRDLTDEEVGQIWAEAVQLYKAGEKLYLSKELEKEAKKIQQDHTEQDERTGMIAEYLDLPLPEDWNAKDVYQRREWLRDAGSDSLQAEGTQQRDKVCIPEIWCEVLGGQQRDMSKYNTKDLHDIMRSMEGWKEYPSKLRFGVYGVQRAYVRITGKKEVLWSVATKSKNS